ncbi:MucBP domain-containing protein [Lacticaseibacillus huelsenbergensis]
MTRKERQLQLALAERVAHKRLVHSKHLGWVVIGMTSAALGGLAYVTSGPTQIVGARTSEKEPSGQVTTAHARTNQVWTLRPVSEIKAQIQASNKKIYDIKWGDTLSTISEALNESGITTSVERLAQINRIANIDLIYAGAKLYLQGSGENATVTTKGSNGNAQTYNLNPSKPAVASSSDKVAVQTDKGTKVVPSKTEDVKVGQTTSTFGGGQTSTSISTMPIGTDKPTTPESSTDKAVTLTIKAIGPDGKILKTRNILGKVGSNVTVSAPQVAGYELVDGVSTVKHVKLDNGNTSVEFMYKRVVKNISKSVIINKDDQGDTLPNKPDLSKYRLLTSTSKTEVQTMSNGDTMSTTTTTVTYHKIARKTQRVIHNVDESGNELASTEGLMLLKTGTTYKDIVADNGDVTTILTTTNVYKKSPVNSKTGTITVKYVDADTGDVIKPIQTLTRNVGDNYEVAAPQIEGYILEGNNSQSVTVSVDGNTITFSYKKKAGVHDTSKYVIKNIDEQGNSLGDKPDATKYHKISESKPEKTNVQKLPNGDTVTTYTSTITYHKIVNTNKAVTTNVDETNHALGNNPDTSKYKRMSSSEARNTSIASNGDTTTTVTTTFVWHKIVNVNKTVTKNIDEAGSDLGQEVSTTDFHKLTTSTPVKSVATAENGDTVTTYTTTVTYHKIARTTKHVVINVNEQGQSLQSIDGYDLVKSSDTSTNSVADNGDVTTIITTTSVYKKSVVIPTTAKVTIVAREVDGGVLKTSVVDAEIGSTYTVHAPAVDGYDLIGEQSQQVVVSAEGNTVSFGYEKHKPTPVYSTVTVIEKNADGRVMGSHSVQAEIGTNYVAEATQYGGYDLQGPNTQTIRVSPDGNTVIFVYKLHVYKLDTDAIANRLAQLVNEWRQQNGELPLKQDPNLQAGSAVRAQQEADAANKGGINAADHYLPGGQIFSFEPHLKQYDSYHMAENLLVTTGHDVESVAQGAFAQWKNSADHNANMLGTYTDEGLSVVQLDNGMFLALQDFGEKPKFNWDVTPFTFHGKQEQYLSVLKSAAGVTDQDVIDSANRQGIGNVFEGNYYISNHMLKTKDDLDGWIVSGYDDPNMQKSIWTQGKAMVGIAVMKDGTIIGYVPVDRALSKPANQLIAEGYIPW